jgi:hypothetical protein
MGSEDYFSRDMLQRGLGAVKGGILVGGQAVTFQDIALVKVWILKGRNRH